MDALTALAALARARTHRARVRPLAWRVSRPNRWIEARTALPGNFLIFVETGLGPEIVHALGRLTEADWVADWEVVAKSVAAPSDPTSTDPAESEPVPPRAPTGRRRPTD
jgi:hypothetical protein